MANLTSIYGKTAADDAHLSFSKPPSKFICPCSSAVMKDPVMSLNTGLTFDRRAIQAWRIRNGDVCPLTGKKLGLLVDNKKLKKEIAEWKQQVKGYRRVLRGSPTTYFLVNSKQPARPTPASLTPISDALRKQRAKAKVDMFSRVNEMMTSFTDAGMSDYMSRVAENDKEHDWSKPFGGGSSSSKSFKQLKTVVTDATSAGYKYDVQYKSIFHQTLTNMSPPPINAAVASLISPLASTTATMPAPPVTKAYGTSRPPTIPATMVPIPSDLFN